MAGANTQKESRTGKKPVPILQGVQVAVKGHDVTVKGPKGELKRTFRPEVDILQKDGALLVKMAEGSGKAGLQFQGLTRSLLNNMVSGAANGFKRSLDFRGVGYRAEFKNQKLKMTVGMSHQPLIDIPKTISVNIETIDEAGTKYPRVHLESADKELLGRVAARIRAQRPPEPYNGKGVRYTGEQVREKAGKAGKAGA